jgi:hypothetical protein
LGTAWSPDGSGNGLAPFAPSSIDLPGTAPTAPIAPQAPQEPSDTSSSDTGAGEVAGAQTEGGFWSKFWGWLTGNN